MSATLEQLQKEKEEAINALDFAKAKELHQKILDLDQKMEDTSVTGYLDRLNEIINHHRDEYTKLSLEIREFYDNEELSLRKQVSDIFHEVQIKHVEMLMAIEKSAYESYIKEKFWLNPKSEDLVSKSKIAAEQENYEKAKDMLQDAEYIQKSESEIKTNRVKEEFLRKRNMIIEKQIEDMKDLSEKLTQNLINIRKLSDNKLKELSQKINLNATKDYRALLKEISIKEKNKPKRDTARTSVVKSFKDLLHTIAPLPQ